MFSSQLRAGHEVLQDETYLRVCRAVFSIRVLAIALTSVVTPPQSPASGVLLACMALASLVLMSSVRALRSYFSRPILAALDIVLHILYVTFEWPATLGLLVLALTMLAVGLILNPWLGLPALVMGLGTSVILSQQGEDAEYQRFTDIATVGLPGAMLGMTALGWTIRYAFVELKHSRDEVMTQQVHQRELEERSRLARQMHDSLGKTVHGISMAASAIQSAAKAERHEDVVTLAAHLEEATKVAAQEARSLLLGLRRHQDDRPIAELLGDLGRSLANQELAVRTEVTGVADLPSRLTAEIMTIVEEALENVVRHARASVVRVSLAQNRTSLRLEITDDGVGFDRAATRTRERAGHYGLRGMRERTASTGGTFGLTSTPGKGTSIRCIWPLQLVDHAPAKPSLREDTT